MSQRWFGLIITVMIILKHEDLMIDSHTRGSGNKVGKEYKLAALGRQRQTDIYKFKARQYYIVRPYTKEREEEGKMN